ncbi:MAG: hypothetical protein LBU15_04210 [Rickettsiales bacterium]|jgi:hypothetical protein|nr:hypothetical protein [Rickettsiales bacterium]
MSKPLGGGDRLPVKQLSNPKIFTTRDGELKKTKEVTDEDIELLRKAGLLGDVKTLGEDFDPNSSYFHPEFVKEMIENVREEYGDVAAELPISFVDLNKPDSKISAEPGSGLAVVYSDRHTKLLLKRLLPSGKTEIYVLDALNNESDYYIDKLISGNPENFIVKYPVTALTQDEWLGESLGIQYDYTNCISYAVHFARKIYKAVREEKARSEKNVLESFNEVVNRFEGRGTRMVTRDEPPAPVFAMPDFLLRYSGSEGALDRMIEARVKVEGDSKREEINKYLKSKLIPYKNKRREECEEQTKNLREDLVSMGLELENTKKALEGKEVAGVDRKGRRMLEQRVKELAKKSKTIDGEIQTMEIEMRYTYSPAANWRNKDIKNVADGIRRRGRTLGGFVIGPEVATGLGPETGEKEKKVVAEKSPVQQPLPSSSSLPLGVFKNTVKASTDIISGPPSAANVSNLPSPPKVDTPKTTMGKF